MFKYLIFFCCILLLSACYHSNFIAYKFKKNPNIALKQDCIFVQQELKKCKCLKITMKYTLLTFEKMALYEVYYEQKNSKRCKRLDFIIPKGKRMVFYDGQQFVFGLFSSRELTNCLDTTQIALHLDEKIKDINFRNQIKTYLLSPIFVDKSNLSRFF